MDVSSDFHTQKGYDKASKNQLTSTMEDYLEMLCRLCQQEGYTRIRLLAEHLNVRPSSASKMADHLRELGLVEGERYGTIKPTEEGAALGAYLLYRHDLLNRFLCFLNQSEEELEQTERIEHFIDARTIHSIERFLQEQRQ